MNALDKMLEKQEQKSLNDAKRFKELDADTCQLCFAVGPDKRNLIIDCFYQVDEVVPEFISLARVDGRLHNLGYYLRICKTCRARLLNHLELWAQESYAKREIDKDSDGDAVEQDNGRNIPVRVHGAIVMMNEQEFAEYKQRNR